MYALYDLTSHKWFIYRSDGILLCVWSTKELGALPSCVSLFPIPVNATTNPNPVSSKQVEKTMKVGG